MTDKADLKRIIRARQAKTGEAYTTARSHVMRRRAALLGLEDEREAASESPRVEAVVLKVNWQSARMRILGEAGQVTFRSADVAQVVPGHLVTLVIAKRWTWGGDAYASGTIEDPRIEIARLGLDPLTLEGGEVEDVGATYESYRDPDAYAPLWRDLTAEPRPVFRMDRIGWGAFPDSDPAASPVCDAADLAAAGDAEAAREILMETLCRDLRCIDAHAHLGLLQFDHRPRRALLHYEVGIRIAELSLPEGFDGVLAWGEIYNRPFLRCLHGYGLCLWRLGRTTEARETFLRILSLNPADNQGVRFCLQPLVGGESWEEWSRRERAEREEQLARVSAQAPSAPSPSSRRSDGGSQTRYRPS